MSKYRYCLKKFNAVHAADIEIDGITVVAGNNGNGKSTLARWLHYVVYASCLFEEGAFSLLRQEIRQLFGKLYRAYTEMRAESAYVEYDTSFLATYNSLPSYDKSEIDRLLLDSRLACLNFTDDLELFLNTVSSDAKKNRVIDFLASGYEEVILDKGDFAKAFRALLLEGLQKAKSKYDDIISRRPVEVAKTIIKDHFRDQCLMPQDIHLFEDGVDILENGRLGALLGINDTIYVDTPMAVDDNINGLPLWDDLRRKMVEPATANGVQPELSVDAQTILHQINALLGGEVTVVKDATGKKKMRLRQGDSIDISLNEAATGMKTMAYLGRLLMNGYLTEHTLLIIDEPEAHLHPEWIVEFARLLVMLNKLLGVKVVISTHSPDMVAAIHYISEKEGTADTTAFYLSRPAEESTGQFDFVKDEDATNRIFESFNQSFNLIDQYGESNE